MPPRSPVISALAMAPSLPGNAARMRAVIASRKISTWAVTRAAKPGAAASGAGMGAP